MMNFNGILPNYKLVRSFGHDNEETEFVNMQRYPVVTEGIKALKRGEAMGPGRDQVCIVRLNSNGQYEFDSKGMDNIYNRPTRTGEKSTPSVDVHIPDKELIRKLNEHSELSKAIGGMEKKALLNEDAIHQYIRNTFETLVALGIDRATMTQYVREYFPAKQAEHAGSN